MLCLGHEWPWFYRSLGFSRKGIYWRDKQHQVRDWESFLHHLNEFEPEQLHFGSLECSWQKPPRLLEQYHELVFDIDLTDFQRFCPCGEKKQACHQCWLHIEGVQLVLHHLLCHLLGIEERYLLWVFSGKKGIHCLVNDPRLMQLNQQGRQRLIALFSRATVQLLSQFIHQVPTEFLEQVNQLFLQRAVQDRGYLRMENFRTHCLKLVKSQNQAMHRQLFYEWYKPTNHTSLGDWQVLLEIEKELDLPLVDCPSTLIAMQCFYPHIDAGPLQLTHLYKLPFSIHGDTERVALPLQRHQLVSNEWPEGALTRRQLVEQHQQGHLPLQFTEGCTQFSIWLQQGHVKEALF